MKGNVWEKRLDARKAVTALLRKYRLELLRNGSSIIAVGMALRRWHKKYSKGGI